MDRQRQANAESTSTLIQTLQMLQKTDFRKKMGSGIVVNMAEITEGQPPVAEFMLAAEDVEAIKLPIIQSIRSSLHLRKLRLIGEIRDIEKALEG